MATRQRNKASRDVAQNIVHAVLRMKAEYSIVAHESGSAGAALHALSSVPGARVTRKNEFETIVSVDVPQKQYSELVKKLGKIYHVSQDHGFDPLA